MTLSGLAAPSSVTPSRSGMQMRRPHMMRAAPGRHDIDEELARARRHYEALAQLVDVKRERRIAIEALRDISNCISAREAIATANKALASLLLDDA